MKEQMITLSTGQQAVVLVPELVRQLAVVDLTVIKRLAALLPKANFSQIREEFVDQLRDCKNIEEYLEAIRAELSFHSSVNMIQTVEIPTNELEHQGIGS